MEYKKKYANYIKKLSPEQRKAIGFLLQQQREKRALDIEKKNRKTEILDEGKPKRPMSAYLLFAAVKSKNTHMKSSDMKNEWEQLSVDQKSAYKQQAKQLRDAYE